MPMKCRYPNRLSASGPMNSMPPSLAEVALLNQVAQDRSALRSNGASLFHHCDRVWTPAAMFLPAEREQLLSGDVSGLGRRGHGFDPPA